MDRFFLKKLLAGALCLLPLCPVAAAAEVKALPAPSKRVHLGILLPLTGPLAPFGKRALRGALLGSKLFGDEGPRELVFHIADTEGDPSLAAKEVKRLAGEGVTGIIGPLKGDEARSAAKAAREEDLPLLALSPAADLTGGMVFRLFLREEEEVDRLVKFAVEEKHLKRFAILAPDTESGRRYRSLFWDSAVRHGGEITASETFPADESSLEIPLKKAAGIYGLTKAELRERQEREKQALAEAMQGPQLTAEEPITEPVPPPVNAKKKSAEEGPKPLVDFDALFLPVSPSVKVAQMAPQLPYYDITGVTLLGIRSWNYPELVKVGKEYIEGALFPAEWHPSTHEGAEFAESFEKSYGSTPGVLETYAYDAVRLMAEKAAGNDREGLRRGLSSLSGADGVTGPLSAAPGGEIISEPVILAVSRSMIVPAETADPR
ncbi:penicillin-binding protein activator [bacterium]|nr:MAG: penicillin-binding protein activator [bacterium]